MNAARLLRWARLTAGLSQRALAGRSGIPQATVGRIESGKTDPRCGTLSHLLRACGYDLDVEPLRGKGVDRSLIRSMLALTPDERIADLAEDERVLELLRAARRSRKQAQA